MEERTDSWHHLQDHSTPPPREVFENLRELLDSAALANAAATNPTAETAPAFRRLADHSIPPPAHLRSAIMDAVIPAANGRSKKWLPYAAAAACVLLLAIGFIRYKNVRGNKPGVAQNRAYLPPVVTPSALSSGSLPATASATSVVKDSVRTAPIRLSTATLTLDGDRFALADNSPLMTFTSYRYPNLVKDIDNDTKNETALRIHLDQYTDITLSPAMTAALHDLYDTRKDGSLSSKARKTRERLEKWNAEDKKEFDPHNAANPLDAVDLAEFLFPPLFSFGHHPGSIPTAAAAQSQATHASDIQSQATQGSATPDSATRSSLNDNSPLTISYTLALITKKTNTGIGETYNGGMQTLFMQNGYSRLRFASLMRIQSEIITPGAPTVTILAESVKPRREVDLTPGQWSAYTGKYAAATYSLVDDSVVILRHHCKKALIGLRDGRRITAWYTPDIHSPAQARLEPGFAGIPGLVLRYEYTCRRKTVRYTATELSRRPIDPSVFAIP